MEKKIDEKTGKNLFEIAKNLPYILSVQELERIYQVLLENLSDNQKGYFKKLYEKKQYWSRAYNKENSLDSHCTGLVENINKHLKHHVSLKCSLVEYLYRVILFTTEFNLYDALSIDEEISFQSNYSLLQFSPFILIAKPFISEFALKKLVINSIKSIQWKTNAQKSLEVTRGDNEEIKYTLIEDDKHLLQCPCTSFLSLGLPCEHVLKVLTNQQKEKEIMNYINNRWLKSKDEEITDTISIALKEMIDKEKNAGSEVEDQDQKEDLLEEEDKENEEKESFTL